MYKPKMKSGARAVLRLLRGIGKGDFSAYSYTHADEDPKRAQNYQSANNILAKRRMHEIETQKAMIVSELRHQNWKAGGPA